jgi:hypothetical protein
MTYEDLVAELVAHQALIVHCSTVAKEGSSRPLFPEDMRTAAAILDAGQEQLSCSVVWPGHQHSYGAVGIVVRPRSTASITSLKPHDAGSIRDPSTGALLGDGAPFSAQAVAETFEGSVGYNEWTVGDADCVGIFVNRLEPLTVAARVEWRDVPGSDPSMWDQDPLFGEVGITLEDIARLLPGLPILGFVDGEIRDAGGRPVSPYLAEVAGSPEGGPDGAC